MELSIGVTQLGIKPRTAPAQVGLLLRLAARSSARFTNCVTPILFGSHGGTEATATVILALKLDGCKLSNYPFNWRYLAKIGIRRSAAQEKLSNQDAIERATNSQFETLPILSRNENVAPAFFTMPGH